MLRPPEVTKSLADLVTELLQSLQVVRDSLTGLSQGGAHQVIPLSGQLRALLLEKHRDAHALLLEVAEQLGVTPTIFVMDGIDAAMPSGLPEMTFHLAGFPFSLRRERAHQSEVPLHELHSRKLIRFEGQDFSLRQIVEFFAHKAGGAHYSKSVPESFARIFTIGVPDMFSARDALINALGQIARAVYETGVDLVRRVTDLDLYLDLGVLSDVPLSHLLDAAYPDSPMRLSIALGQDRHLVVQAVGINGHGLAVRVPELISWVEPHLVHVSIRHTDELVTVLRVAIDDEVVAAEARSQNPVFLPSQIRDYDMFINKAVDGDVTGSAMALGQLAVLGHSAPADMARALTHFVASRADSDRRVVLYKPGGHGLAVSGQGDLVHTGDVVVSRMSVAMQGDKGDE